MHRLVYLVIAVTLITGCTVPDIPSSTEIAPTSNESPADNNSQSSPPIDKPASEPTAAEATAENDMAETVAAPVLVPTDTPAAAQVEEPVNWLMTATKEGDRYILGNPNAPIRLVDYSDFL